MHRVLHTYYDAQRYQREISDDDLIELFRADLAGAGIADRYQYELYLRQGIEQLRQFFEVARSGAPPDIIETEHRFELQVGSSKLTGRVDRMDRTGPDTVAIVDYKTGKPCSQEDADESLQLSLYAIAARETLGKRADRLVLYKRTSRAISLCGHVCIRRIYHQPSINPVPTRIRPVVTPNGGRSTAISVGLA